MNKLEMAKVNLNRTKINQSLYSFPQFITRLRRDLCLTRQIMADDLQIDYLKLFYLELGSFKKMPDKNILEQLSVYFDVPYYLLEGKAQEFVKTGESNG